MEIFCQVDFMECTIFQALLIRISVSIWLVWYTVKKKVMGIKKAVAPFGKSHIYHINSGIFN